MDEDMERWLRTGNIDKDVDTLTRKWRHGDMHTDMDTWTHDDETWTSRHGHWHGDMDMETWTKA